MRGLFGLGWTVEQEQVLGNLSLRLERGALKALCARACVRVLSNAQRPLCIAAARRNSRCRDIQEQREVIVSQRLNLALCFSQQCLRIAYASFGNQSSIALKSAYDTDAK